MSESIDVLPDRRTELRREYDKRLIGALITAVTIAISVGVAWGTATAALTQKVDRVEQLQIDAKQDARLDRGEIQTSALLDAIQHLQSGVDSANLRLHQIACDGQPASCR